MKVFWETILYGFHVFEHFVSETVIALLFQTIFFNAVCMANFAYTKYFYIKQPRKS